MIPLLCLERNPNVPVTPQEEASLTLKLDRKPCRLYHNPKDTDFPSTRDKALFEWNPEY